MAERLTPRSTALFAAALALAAGIAVVRPGLAQSPPSLSSQSQEQADAKSVGCMSCHTKTDQKSMHASTSVRLGCTDCHGGDSSAKTAGTPGSGEYKAAQQRAHVQPPHRAIWKTSANAERAYTRIPHEPPALPPLLPPN